MKPKKINQSYLARFVNFPLLVVAVFCVTSFVLFFGRRASISQEAASSSSTEASSSSGSGQASSIIEDCAFEENFLTPCETEGNRGLSRCLKLIHIGGDQYEAEYLVTAQIKKFPTMKFYFSPEYTGTLRLGEQVDFGSENLSLDRLALGTIRNPATSELLYYDTSKPVRGFIMLNGTPVKIDYEHGTGALAAALGTYIDYTDVFGIPEQLLLTREEYLAAEKTLEIETVHTSNLLDIFGLSKLWGWIVKLFGGEKKCKNSTIPIDALYKEDETTGYETVIDHGKITITCEDPALCPSCVTYTAPPLEEIQIGAGLDILETSWKMVQLLAPQGRRVCHKKNTGIEMQLDHKIIDVNSDGCAKPISFSPGDECEAYPDAEDYGCNSPSGARKVKAYYPYLGTMLLDTHWYLDLLQAAPDEAVLDLEECEAGSLIPEVRIAPHDGNVTKGTCPLKEEDISRVSQWANGPTHSLCWIQPQQAVDITTKANNGAIVYAPVSGTISKILLPKDSTLDCGCGFYDGGICVYLKGDDDKIYAHCHSEYDRFDSTENKYYLNHEGQDYDFWVGKEVHEGEVLARLYDGIFDLDEAYNQCGNLCWGPGNPHIHFYIEGGGAETFVQESCGLEYKDLFPDFPRIEDGECCNDKACSSRQGNNGSDNGNNDDSSDIDSDDPRDHLCYCREDQIDPLGLFLYKMGALSSRAEAALTGFTREQLAEMPFEYGGESYDGDSDGIDPLPHAPFFSAGFMEILEAVSEQIKENYPGKCVPKEMLAAILAAESGIRAYTKDDLDKFYMADNSDWCSNVCWYCAGQRTPDQASDDEIYAKTLEIQKHTKCQGSLSYDPTAKSRCKQGDNSACCQYYRVPREGIGTTSCCDIRGIVQFSILTWVNGHYPKNVKPLSLAILEAYGKLPSDVDSYYATRGRVIDCLVGSGIYLKYDCDAWSANEEGTVMKMATKYYGVPGVYPDKVWDFYRHFKYGGDGSDSSSFDIDDYEIHTGSCEEIFENVKNSFPYNQHPKMHKVTFSYSDRARFCMREGNKILCNPAPEKIKGWCAYSPRQANNLFRHEISHVMFFQDIESTKIREFVADATSNNGGYYRFTMVGDPAFQTATVIREKIYEQYIVPTGMERARDTWYNYLFGDYLYDDIDARAVFREYGINIDNLVVGYDSPFD